MSLLLLLPMAAFLAVNIGLIWLHGRLQVELIERHPQAWLEHARRAVAPANVIYRLAWGRRLRDMHDDVLDRWLKLIRWLRIAQILTFLVLIGCIVLVVRTQT